MGLLLDMSIYLEWLYVVKIKNLIGVFKLEKKTIKNITDASILQWYIIIRAINGRFVIIIAISTFTLRLTHYTFPMIF